MKKMWVKSLGIVLTAALLAGSVGAGVYAAGNKGTESAIETESEESTEPDTSSLDKLVEDVKDASVSDLIRKVEEDGKISKDETVYVIAGADGKASRIIVSDWIKNPENSDTVSDKTELSDAEITKGNATYTMDKDNMRVWTTDGEDVYYQGTSDKELPVTLKVTYTLDGKEVTAEELAGKSGHVVIRFDYENNQYENVEIDGKEEKIYVPFAVLTGMILDDDVFSNVEVTNGRLINDGSHEAVVGIALPGLKDNLALDDDKLNIPDYVEVEADVKDFALTTTMTIATNEIFNKVEVEDVDTDSLRDVADQITDAFEQLSDGSEQLYDGLCTLLEKSKELTDGIDKLAAGAKTVKEGMATLNTGAAKLASGASELNNGLQKLSANSAALNKGAETVFNSLLTQANSQLSGSGLGLPALTIGNYSQVLTDAITKLNGAAGMSREDVEKQVRANEPQFRAAVTATVKQSVTESVTAQYRQGVETAVLSGYGFSSKEDYDAAVEAGSVDEAIQTAIESAIDAGMASKQSEIDAKVAATMESDAIKQKIDTETENAMQAKINETMKSVGQASGAVTQLKSLKSQLDSYNQFYTGLKTYTAGVDAAANGASSLYSGANELAAGAGKLADGTTELSSGLDTMQKSAPALIDGITELRDGAGKLSDGLSTLNEKGIGDLTESLGEDLDTFVARLKATADVSKDYNNYAGIADDMAGQVKFIYRTEGIED